jgi:hypothetical protein
MPTEARSFQRLSRKSPVIQFISSIIWRDSSIIAASRVPRALAGIIGARTQTPLFIAIWCAYQPIADRIVDISAGPSRAITGLYGMAALRGSP